jgi:glycolate oxidase FAD binding subunit
VTGRGELVRAGGRVVKNVTGYDVPKLLAGSWGTLAVLTEVTVRVAPAPETERTLRVASRTPEDAVRVLTAALGSAHDVSAAAFDPTRGSLLRLEGFAASVDARAAALRDLLAPVEVEAIDVDESRTLWREIGSASALAGHPVVWRVSVPPTDAPRAVAALAPERYVLDWGGGLILAAYRDVEAARVRGAVPHGHATLLKAPEDARRAVSSFPPQEPRLAALAARVKQAFDPHAKLNPGRME